MLAFEIKYVQSSYLLINEKKIAIHVTYMWQSSLNLNKTNNPLWIISNTSSLIFTEKDFDATDWIIVNIQQTGYYRVKYDFENLQKLQRYLNSKHYAKIHILNRAQIIDDAFYFLLQKQLKYSLFWNLTRFVTRDANFVTWYPMIKVFESFACLYPLEYGLKVTRNMKSRIIQILTKIGYTEKPTDHTLTIYLREEAVKWACILNVSKCQEVATSELNKEVQNSVENSSLIGKKWIYCYGLRRAEDITRFYMWQKWNATSDERYLEYLACCEDSVVICSFLTAILEKIPHNDNKRTNKRVNAFLFTVTKHARTAEVHSCIFHILKSFPFIFNWIRRHDIIATLIVIITHMNPATDTEKIMKFASNYQLTKAVEEKIRKRRVEYGDLARNYWYYFS
nr:PREDICTED: aminopeptidase N-like isoform X1 [Linepithema humile]XP_012232970.1 PREDICTED: aminopeptidase N-like isoform X1 [Linepithema humile]